jgi:hypothetical protein
VALSLARRFGKSKREQVGEIRPFARPENVPGESASAGD